MLEITVHNNADIKPVDGKRQHLSSVNDHRVLLSLVDPTTNFMETIIDGTSNGKCGDDNGSSQLSPPVNVECCTTRVDFKELDCVKDENSSETLGVEEVASDADHGNYSMISGENSPMFNDNVEELGKSDQMIHPETTSSLDDPNLVDPKEVKIRYKVGKRRKRIPWGNEYNKRQKNPKRLPRSEMPHEELLKLREKERKAQQQRRERMRRSEETKIKLLTEKINKTSSSMPDDLNENGLLEDRGQCDDEKLLTSLCSKSFLSSKDTSLTCAESAEADALLEENKPERFPGAREQNKPSQRQKTAEMCSVAEFLANNVEATSIDSSYFDASKSSTNELVSDKSYQSWSEESSDCSDRRTSCDSATKKTRRSNLPREELERLREKERLAKRRQRAKNKRDVLEGQSDAMELDTNCVSYEIDNSTDTDSMAEWKGNIGKSNSQADESEKINATNELVDEGKEASARQVGGKKRAFPRYYDRSMLSAEELESLRRREREYQRRRRARLREAKFKGTDEFVQVRKSFIGSQGTSNEVAKEIDDAKKYETRMSKGISRPSLRFLEHSSLAGYENEFNNGKVSMDEKGKEDKQKWNTYEEDQTSLDYTTSVSMVHDDKFASHPTEGLAISDKNSPEMIDRGLEPLSVPDPISQNPPPNEAFKSREGCIGLPRDLLPKRLSAPKSPAQELEEKHLADAQMDMSGLVFVNDKKMLFDNERPLTNVCEETPKVPTAVNRRSPKVNNALFASDCKILQANGYRRMNSEQNYHYFDVQAGSQRPYELLWNGKINTSPDVLKCNDRQNEKFYENNTLSNDFGTQRHKKFNEERSKDLDIKKDAEPSTNNKWRHWKSGLTDSQLQRRRQSNREAQRRRRMRLRLMQMKSLQEQDHISYEEIMYKRFTPNKRAVVNEAVDAFHSSKSKLKNMLEKRQKVFMDAQIEKSKNETELKDINTAVPEQCKKGRGCRIKVTPTRNVVVPTMGYPPNFNITEKAGPVSDELCFRELKINGNQINSYAVESSHSPLSHTSYEEKQSSDHEEEQAQQTSSRKRKQFCPRRLLSEAERNNHENVPSLVTAQ